MDLIKIYLEPKLQINRKLYNTSTNYINIESITTYDYQHVSNNEESWTWDGYYDNEKTTSRLLQLSNTVGFGFGKVRDVTPVIKTLRVKQRYNSLGRGELSSQQLGNLSKAMA